MTRGRDALGFSFTAVLVLGTLAVAQGHGAGWLLRAAGTAGWAWLGWRMKWTALLVTEVGFLAVDLYGAWRALH